MSVWLLAAMILIAGAVVPAIVLISRGSEVRRLVALQLLGSTIVLVMMLLAQGFGQPQYLIVPLVLVVLSFAGTLVFVRLSGARR
jgi:multisubunit Na+/H+ antiporter MnhF subunit